MITDENIIELFFARSEQGMRELDIKYGKVFHNLSYHIVGSRQDAEECVNDAYLGAWFPGASLFAPFPHTRWFAM